MRRKLFSNEPFFERSSFKPTSFKPTSFKPTSFKPVRPLARTGFRKENQQCRDEKGENQQCRDEKGENREGLWDTSQAEWKKQNTLLASNSETPPRTGCFWTRFCFWNGAGQSSPLAVSHRTLSGFLLFHLFHYSLSNRQHKTRNEVQTKAPL